MTHHRPTWICIGLLLVAPVDAAEQWMVRAGKLIDVERGPGDPCRGDPCRGDPCRGDPSMDIEKLRQVRGVMKAGRQIRLD